MKNLLLIVLCFAFSTDFAAAKTTTLSASKIDIRKPIKKWLKQNKNNFRVSVATGTLNSNFRFRESGNTTSSFERSFNDSSNSNLALNFGYENNIKENIGYSTYLTYQNSELELNGDTEEFRNYRVSANATYRLDKQVQVYGGLNYGAWYGSKEIEDALDAGIGYQLGLDFKMHKKAHLELEYLSLLNEGKMQGFNLDTEVKGLMIKAKMPITINL
jgi:hypothetical protein